MENGLMIFKSHLRFAFLILVVSHFVLAATSCKKKSEIKKPVYEFSYTGDLVVFDTLKFTSTAPIAAPISWDFGDSTYSMNREPTHVYSKAGTYSVSMKVYNDTAVAFQRILLIGYPNGSEFTAHMAGTRLWHCTEVSHADTYKTDVMRDVAVINNVEIEFGSPIFFSKFDEVDSVISFFSVFIETPIYHSYHMYYYIKNDSMNCVHHYLNRMSDVTEYYHTL